MPPNPKNTTALLKQLRALMNNHQFVSEPISAYIVPSIDAHNSEYLADCDKFRAFISGFTGSAGTAIITDKEALLWTDGRYYLQASEQMDSNWTLMKEGLSTTPSQDDWLSKHLPCGSLVGVDPNLYTHTMWKNLQMKLEASSQKLVPVAGNLISSIWTDRPPRPTNPIHPLPLKYTGKNVAEKLAAVRSQMRDNRSQYLVLSALDEIAWFLNLRGSDIAYNPVFFSFVVITQNSIVFFVRPQQVNDEIHKHLSEELNGGLYLIKNYSEIELFLKEIGSRISDEYVWFSETANYSLTNLIPSRNILSQMTPIPLMKAVKNPVEIKGMENAHIKDGVALCAYFAWLEKNVAGGSITEISGAKKLEEFRSLQEDFMGPSFSTISSVGPHGAIIHYEPQASTDVPITTDTLYLCDSGAQFRDGTTDVTRTLHFGTPTQYEKECFTRVLKGQIKLATTIFPSKIKGNCLDSFAREALWAVGLDYAHGTGHGIGSYLNVHEGPMGISFRAVPDDPGLEPGMFVSNEPGYYEDGKFGIRIEDIVKIVPANPPYNFNNRGYLTFETITYCPKQTKLILPEILTEEEIKHMNDYHQKCRTILGPLLEAQGLIEAKNWLWRETEPIKRV